jgi:predicted nucleic-acid-binding Zn-ribbon protein
MAGCKYLDFYRGARKEEGKIIDLLFWGIA